MTSSKNSSIRRNEEESFLSFTIPSPFRRSEILPYWDDIVSFPGLTTGVADSPITTQQQSNKPTPYFRQPFYNTCNTNRQDGITPCVQYPFLFVDHMFISPLIIKSTCTYFQFQSSLIYLIHHVSGHESPQPIC